MGLLLKHSLSFCIPQEQPNFGLQGNNDHPSYTGAEDSLHNNQSLFACSRRLSLASRPSPDFKRIDFDTFKKDKGSRIFTTLQSISCSLFRCFQRSVVISFSLRGTFHWKMTIILKQKRMYITIHFPGTLSHHFLYPQDHTHFCQTVSSCNRCLHKALWRLRSDPP